MKTQKTRFAELGYRQDSPGNWRIVDIDGDASIGPYYRSKAELMGDLERYYAQYTGTENRRVFDAINAWAKEVCQCDCAPGHGGGGACLVHQYPDARVRVSNLDKLVMKIGAQR